MNFAVTGRLADASSELPNRWRMAGNLAKSGVAVARQFATNGRVRADETTQASRALVCSLCDRHEIIGGHERCLDHRCGCYLAVKRTLLAATCPRGWWTNSTNDSRS